MVEPTNVWRLLSIILVIVAALEVFRAGGLVTRPLAVLVLVLAALEVIFIFGIVPTPGTIGLTGWIAIISTAILSFSVELVRLSGGVRTASLSLLVLALALLQLVLAIGFVRI